MPQQQMFPACPPIFRPGFRQKRQRGMAVFTVLGLMALMSVAALSVLSLVMTVMKSAQRRGDVTEAFNVADAGADLGRFWLSQNSSQNGPPNAAALVWSGTTKFYGTNGTITDPFNSNPGVTLTVRIDPDTINTDSTQTQKRYLIEAQAKMPSGVTQTVREYVQQTSFGHYAVFVDSNPGNAYWANNHTNVFDGPVHSNNSNAPTNGTAPQPTGAANNLLWNSAAGATPIFTYNGPDAFTVSGPTINYWKDSAFNTVTPTNEADWKKIAASGSAGIKTGTPMIGFPPKGNQLTLQHDAALGTASVPSASGVQVNADGGIYIHCKNSSSTANPAPPGSAAAKTNNDVQTMVLGKDNTTGYQQITIQQGSDYTHIPDTHSSDSNQETLVTIVTLIPGGGVYKKYANFYGPNQPDLVNFSNADTTPGKPYEATIVSGVPNPNDPGIRYNGGANGVVYCDGNIGNQNGADGSVGTGSAAKTGGLSGTVLDHQALTIATDPAKNTNINGDIKYNTPRQKYQAGDTLPPGYAVGDYKPEAADTGNFKTQAGTLGIVSNNIEVTRYSDLAKTAEITNPEVDAAAFAYGTYDACAYDVRTQGTMLNMGCYLVGTRGIFNRPPNGIACSRLYDNRLGNTPPPYFPTTGTQYEVVSWQRVGGLL